MLIFQFNEVHRENMPISIKLYHAYRSEEEETLQERNYTSFGIRCNKKFKKTKS